MSVTVTIGTAGKLPVELGALVTLDINTVENRVLRTWRVCVGIVPVMLELPVLILGWLCVLVLLVLVAAGKSM